MLVAIEQQAKEQDLRQRFNLFIPQWPNPSSWLTESRWEDEVHLEETFYQNEIARRNSGIKHNQQTIKQQREYYLDDHYKSRISGKQAEQSCLANSRQNAIRKFDEEFRNRKNIR